MAVEVTIIHLDLQREGYAPGAPAFEFAGAHPCAFCKGGFFGSAYATIEILNLADSLSTNFYSCHWRNLFYRK
jgi:hypothetical protein